MEISRIQRKALLAEASYANLQAAKNPDGTFNPEKIKAALITEGFSPTQADHFISHWRLVDHQPNTTSGFSATLFENLDSPGNYTLAMRGTEFSLLDPRDLIIDAGLATGLIPQRSAMDAYYNRLLAEGKLSPARKNGDRPQFTLTFYSDGHGKILIDGDRLTSNKHTAEHLWQSTDGRVIQGQPPVTWITDNPGAWQ